MKFKFKNVKKKNQHGMLTLLFFDEKNNTLSLIIKVQYYKYMV